MKIEKNLEKYLRVDVIIDQYDDDSLKSHTRNGRGDCTKWKSSK